MAQTWPATVPDTLSVSEYRESPPDNLLRQGMDVGPPKVRRRTTANVRPISGKIIMTTTELAAFDTFFTSTLASGSLTFNFDHPRTGTTEEMRFTAPPQYINVGPTHWEVSVHMEVLP
jgi:hypothetical protein